MGTVENPSPPQAETPGLDREVVARKMWERRRTAQFGIQWGTAKEHLDKGMDTLIARLAKDTYELTDDILTALADSQPPTNRQEQSNDLTARFPEPNKGEVGLVRKIKSTLHELHSTCVLRKADIGFGVCLTKAEWDEVLLSLEKPPTSRQGAGEVEALRALRKLLDRYHVMGCGDGPEALEAARVLRTHGLPAQTARDRMVDPKT